MFRLQGPGCHTTVTERVQFVGHQRQDVRPVALGTIGAFPALLAELFELVVQVSHRVLLVC